MPALNERFCEMAALTPQTILWEIERLSPAGTLVEAATSQSRRSLAASVGRQCVKTVFDLHLRQREARHSRSR